MVDIDRDFELDRDRSDATHTKAKGKGDLVNPHDPHEPEVPFSVGMLPSGQWILLKPIPPHLGVRHRQAGSCKGDHAAELAQADDAGLLSYLDGGPNCKIVVWAKAE